MLRWVRVRYGMRGVGLGGEGDDHCLHGMLLPVLRVSNGRGQLRTQLTSDDRMGENVFEAEEESRREGEVQEAVAERFAMEEID